MNNSSSFSLSEWARNNSQETAGVESFSGVQGYSVLDTVTGLLVILIFANLVRIYWDWGDDGFVGHYVDMTTLLGLLYLLYLVGSGGVF